MSTMQVSFGSGSGLDPFAGTYTWYPEYKSYLLKSYDNGGMQYLGILFLETFGGRSAWKLGLFKGSTAATTNQMVFVVQRISPSKTDVINKGDQWVYINGAEDTKYAYRTPMTFVQVEGQMSG